MSVEISNASIKEMVKALILKGNYRPIVITLLDREFLEYVMDFFRKVVEAKMKYQAITIDWYEKEFLDDSLTKKEIASNAGLNEKTITNVHGNARKETVIEASRLHYEQLHKIIDSMEDDVNVILTIKFNSVGVELTVKESLIVINALAVKRAALRGGYWSVSGKRVEKPLMVTLCKIFGVEHGHYDTGTAASSQDTSVNREVDFNLVDERARKYACEVKLMGRGNPESADGAIARDSNIFVADKLSESNKKDLDEREILWVELSEPDGYKKFGQILQECQIPHHACVYEDIEQRLEEILEDDSVFE